MVISDEPLEIIQKNECDDTLTGSRFRRVFQEIDRLRERESQFSAALVELRANYERRANKSNWPDEDDLDWRAAFDLALTELDAAIAKFGLGKRAMTEQGQRQACAELAQRVKGNAGLARAMGYQLRLTTGNLPDAHVIAPDGKRLSLGELPDYFTDADASWKLRLWLASDDDRWRKFTYELFGLFEKTEIKGWDYVRAGMTADPSIIASAACKALGIQVN